MVDLERMLHFLCFIMDDHERFQSTLDSRQLVTGLGFLIIGALLYILCRPADSTHLGRLLAGIPVCLPFKIHLYKPMAGVLPDYIHPLSFALLTLALLPKAGRVVRTAVCLFWLTIDLMFEIGQRFLFLTKAFLSSVLPEGSLLNLLTGYFDSGTFDHLDILAIILGSITAFFISEFYTERRQKL